MTIRRSALLFLPVLVAAVASAAVPPRINYQGKLLDPNGNPRTGDYTITFSIWDDGPAVGGGTMLWSSEREITVSNGVFAAQLGRFNPLPVAVFSGATTYLQVEIDGEVASQRQRLTSSPYAFRAATADDLAPGDADYVQNTAAPQEGAQFHVSSATVSGTLTVGSVIAGSDGVALTTPAGLLDASKLSGAVPSGSLSGSYPAMTVGGVLPGDDDYVQNRATLQPGASFYVAGGSVAGPFAATGTVTLGGAPGVDDVSVQSDLAVAGDVRVNGGDLLDAAGVPRLSLGAGIVVGGDLSPAAGAPALRVSAPLALVGPANGDNYVSFPFTAGSAVAAKDVVIITGANTVGRTTSDANPDVIGFAVNDAQVGETVYVAMVGIVTGVTTDGAVTQSNMVCTSNAAGRVDDSCNSNGAPIGKALTGATGAGQTITVALFHGR